MPVPVPKFRSLLADLELSELSKIDKTIAQNNVLCGGLLFTLLRIS